MSIERVLSKSQARAVIAMVRERERIMHEANEQIGEINAALDEQAEMMRAHFGLPEGAYIFEGNPNGVTLKMKPEEKAPVEGQGETPAEPTQQQPANDDPMMAGSLPDENIIPDPSIPIDEKLAG